MALLDGDPRPPTSSPGYHAQTERQGQRTPSSATGAAWITVREGSPGAKYLRTHLQHTHSRRKAERSHSTPRRRLDMRVYWVLLMHCGAACFLFALAALSSSQSDTGTTSATSMEQTCVRRGSSLCSGELDYIRRRKQLCAQALSALGLSCTEEEVPHVALLASGGGQRAAVALVGSLSQLSQDGLLDTVLYLGGVSGSTWSMASLYSDPEWSRSLDSHVASLLTPQTVELDQALSWVRDTAQREEFSLTDVWGALTAAGIMKQWDTRKLSEETTRNISNPYPVYGAIEKHCFNHGPVQARWFELTPHEAGFSELGLFIQTSALGSKFQGGALLEDKPEMDMIQVQGILGCALANEKMEEHIPAWLNVPTFLDTAAEAYLRSYNTITTFITQSKAYVTNEAALKYINNLQAVLQDKVNRNESILLGSQSPEQRAQQFQHWTSELGTVVQEWAHSLPEGTTKAHVSLLVDKLMPLVLRWEWGTVKNFLYKCAYPSLSELPEARSPDGCRLLVNVAYPSFLGSKRDIDLIIAPEYSAGDMFETLTLARAYAAEVQKPFPQLDDQVLKEEKDWPRDCYVFEGNGTAPTIVFMPLFNRRNCKANITESHQPSTWQNFAKTLSSLRQTPTNELWSFEHTPVPHKGGLSFVRRRRGVGSEDGAVLHVSEELQSGHDQVLLETAHENMRNNKETLLTEIKKALKRRRDRSPTAQVQPEQQTSD
ncbi:hypothetical protein WMY93_001924 [Mugilogobius chulae]|uniref:PLA2c domain-containing protein n=1 Tax=Mugilogobius chulae TaxID=88201 RepID=A0AAW0PS32_9GOBI